MRDQPCKLHILPLFILLLATVCDAAEDPSSQFLSSSRTVFLGDSITASGGYIADLEAWLFANKPEHRPHIINCGLPSETVSGLSEDGHAGGQFPRPELFERLQRVLDRAKPDLVFACYGINCGIYQPYDASRFEKYQQGMQRLKESVEKAGAKLVIITPPFYDDQRKPMQFSYNEVLDRYSNWLLEQRDHGWIVIDLHGPMTQTVRDRRKTEPNFTFQPDGVHPNDQGHWFIAQQLIAWLGDSDVAKCSSPQEMLKLKNVPAAILPLVQQRVATLRDAYVGAAGHKRPGVGPGLPIAEAEAKAESQAEKIAAELPKSP